MSEIAKNDAIRPLLASSVLAKSLIDRVSGGDSPAEAMAAVHDLADSGRFVTLERAWVQESALDLDATIADYEEMITLLGASGLGSVAEIIVPAAMLAVPRGPEALHEICALATDNGVAVMISASAAAQVDTCLEASLRQQAIGRDVGITLQASLRRTEQDCRNVRGRVRVVKFASEPARGSDAYGQSIEVDKSFIRCAKALLARGDEVSPSFATHDSRMLSIIETIAVRCRRDFGGYEFAMYLGRSGSIQQRLVEAGENVRVFVPFGHDWFGRLVGGLVERPSGVASAVRAILPGS
jgi:proline dehydrogenase